MPDHPRRARRLPLLALLPMLATAADIPATFHGRWVRADAGCDAPLALTLEARRLAFQNGRDAQAFTRLALCSTCNDPSDDSGTLQVLADAPDGSPFLVYLMPGTPPTVTMNWNPSEPALARRYPLAPEPLKRCEG